jgi:hypothetical protein
MCQWPRKWHYKENSGDQDPERFYLNSIWSAGQQLPCKETVDRTAMACTVRKKGIKLSQISLYIVAGAEQYVVYSKYLETERGYKMATFHMHDFSWSISWIATNYVLPECTSSFTNLLISVDGSLSVYFYKHKEFALNDCFPNWVSDIEMNEIEL